MEIGTEWLIEAAGCRPEALRDREILHSLFERILDDLALTALHEPLWHVFPGEGGITGFVMLTESHLACHTYPEHGVATFNLYCCRPRPDWPWHDHLVRTLGATEVRIRSVERSMAAELVE